MPQQVVINFVSDFYTNKMLVSSIDEIKKVAPAAADKEVDWTQYKILINEKDPTPGYALQENDTVRAHRLSVKGAL